MTQIDRKCPDDQTMPRLSSRENRPPQYNRACRCGCGCMSSESENGSDDNPGCICVGEKLFELPNVENLNLESEDHSSQPNAQIGSHGHIVYVPTRHSAIIIAEDGFQHLPMALPQDGVPYVTAWNSHNRVAAPNSVSQSMLNEPQMSTHRSIPSSSIQSMPRGSHALQGLGAWKDHLAPSYFNRAPLVLTPGRPPRAVDHSQIQWWPTNSDCSGVESYSSCIAEEDLGA